MKALVVAALLAWQLGAAELKPQTVEAFDRYIKETEHRLDNATGFLWADESPDRAQRVKQGLIVVAPFGKRPDVEVTGGLVHDWVGSVFIPGATIEKTIEKM